MSSESPTPLEKAFQEMIRSLKKTLEDQNEALKKVAEALSKLNLSQSLPETQSDQSNTTEPPRSEIPSEGSPDSIFLPDGRSVPTKVVAALSKYDSEVWPGAVLPEARASVAWAVLNAVKSEEEEVPALRTNYPFCLDANPSGAPEGVDSPCILKADHRGRHMDNNDGVWPNRSED